jgi:two-component system sensor histidine kinase BaeS
MSLRVKLFGAMAALVVLMGVAYLASTQVYLRRHVPALVAAVVQANGETAGTKQVQESIYNSMFHVAFKVVMGLSVFALLIGFWLTRVLTAPLKQLTTVIGRIGEGELRLTIPETPGDEVGQVAAALNRMAAKLARSEEVRKRLVADVAHELRTPLTIVLGQFELLQQKGEAVLPQMLLPLQDEVLRLSRLVDDLHQLSLAEAGKLPLERRSTDLYELLNRLTEMLRLEAEEMGVRLALVSSADDSVLTADSHRLTQVFYNLIGNAIRYTPAGGEVSIRLSSGGKGGDKSGLQVVIADSGVGIAGEHLPHLFDRFYRVEDDRTRHSGGMGLGLAIAKQFVEAHDGRIEVESALGQGTTVAVTLPRRTDRGRPW